MKYKKIIKWSLLIIWMLIIFSFSNQPNSGEVTHSFIENLLPIIKTNSLIDTLNFIIRKLAHIMEYLILAFLSISLLKEYTKQEKTILLSTLIFCILYALTDEYHQSLVAGRTSTIKDVFIDTIGVIITLITELIIQRKTNRTK